LNDTSISVIIMGIILMFGVSLVLTSQGYFDVFTPEPRMSLTEISFGSDGSGCDIDFTLVNSGDADGFAVVELRTGPAKNLIEQNRYFVKANTMDEKKIFTDAIPFQYCNKLRNTIGITLTERG